MKEVLSCKLGKCYDLIAMALCKQGGMYVHMAKTFRLDLIQNHKCIPSRPASRTHLFLLFFCNVFILFSRLVIFSVHFHWLAFYLLFLKLLKPKPCANEVAR